MNYLGICICCRLDYVEKFCAFVCIGGVAWSGRLVGAFSGGGSGLWVGGYVVLIYVWCGLGVVTDLNFHFNFNFCF